jgi:hypothetical protein
LILDAILFDDPRNIAVSVLTAFSFELMLCESANDHLKRGNGAVI